MFTLKIKIIAALISVGILSFAGYSAYIYHKGSSAAVATQATEQLKQNEKVRKSYDKIDRETPYSADGGTKLDWLYKHSTAN